MQGSGGGGGLSPGKLRNILLMAVDKKRRAEMEIDVSDSSNFDLGSQLPSHIDANSTSLSLFLSFLYFTPSCVSGRCTLACIAENKSFQC